MKTLDNNDFIADSGTIGPPGPPGPTGPQGPIGPASIATGNVTTVDYPANATVTNVGTDVEFVLDFSIPRGPRGPQGPVSIAVGNVTTLPPGANASVTNSGTADDLILEFAIPQGNDGTTIDGAASTVKSANLAPNTVVISNALGKIAASNVSVANLEAFDSRIDTKQDLVTGAASTITSSNLHANFVLVSSVAGKVAVSNVAVANLAYIRSSRSDIQTQLDTGFASINAGNVNTGTLPQAVFPNILGNNSTTIYTDKANVVSSVSTPVLYGNTSGATANMTSSISTPVLYGNLFATIANVTSSMSTPVLYGNVSGPTATHTAITGNLTGATANVTSSVSTPVLYGNLSATIANVTSSMSTPNLYGNVSGATVSGNLAAVTANVSLSISTPVVYGNLVGTTSNVTNLISNFVTAQVYYGDGGHLSNIVTSVIGNDVTANSVTANFISTANINATVANVSSSISTPTVYGNLSGATVTGNLTAVTANVSSSISTPTLYGNVSGATVTGNLTAATANVSSSISTPTLYGNVSGATANVSSSISTPTVYGNVSGATVTGNLTAVTGNVSSSISTPALYGNVSSATVTGNSITANYLYGNGFGISNINASNITGALEIDLAGDAAFGGNVVVDGSLSIGASNVQTIATPYAYFGLSSNVVTSGVSAAGNVNVSVSATNGAVQALQFIAVSDERIKSDIEDVDAKALVRAVSEMRVRSWKYKDVLAKGSRKRIGFIAQELEGILPEAVFVSSRGEFVPDIYAIASRAGDAYVCSQHGLVENQKVRICTRQKTIDTTVKEVQSVDTITFEHPFEEDAIFIYGSWQDDVRSVDYDALLAALVTAIQDLQSQVYKDIGMY